MRVLMEPGGSRSATNLKKQREVEETGENGDEASAEIKVSECFDNILESMAP